MIQKILSQIERVWWHFEPYVEVNVQWPVGTIVIDRTDPRWYDVGAYRVEIESADPNDHYRPFLEEWIGRQRWDWAWYLGDTDARDNRLTIRLRKKYAAYASHITLMWN